MTPSRTIDLRLLAYFQKTAELGGITRAAGALNVAQPTLSKALQQLEYQLGAALFERRPHGVVLTPIGERLLRHTRIVMAQVGDAVEEVEDLRTGMAGRVRIGAGPSWVRRVLPETIAEVLAERPELSVTVSGGFDETLLHGLDNGELDVVVAEIPPSRGKEGYAVEMLTSDRLIVCARRDHALVGRPNLTIDAILDQPWALPPPHTLARRKFEGRLVSLGLPSPTAVTVSNSLTFLLSLVSGSDALTYTTGSALRTLEGRALAPLDVPDLISSRDAGLILRRPGLMSPATTFVVDKLRRRCRRDPRN